ncbi:MAG: UPF0182 family membrane protein [Chloroflexia bacterium]
MNRQSHPNNDPPRKATLEDEYEERFVRPKPAGTRPPTRIPRRGGSPLRGGCLPIVVIVVLIVLFGPVLLETSVDWQWFGSLGLQDVYGTRLAAGFGVFGAGLVVAAIFLALNWLAARRVVTQGEVYAGQQQIVDPRLLGLGLAAGVAVVGLIMGFIAAGEWSTVLTYFNHTGFGSSDAIFHQDIGFYVFELPFYEFLRNWALGLVVLAAIGTAVIYATRPGLLGAGQRFSPDPRLVAHLSFLGVAFLLLMAVGYWFNQYDLLFSSHNALHGVSYTDEHARLFAFQVLIVVTVGIALLLLVNLRRRALVPLAVGAAVWVLAQVVVGGIYPGIVQTFSVQPAEKDKESPYIANNIAATRAAFGLDKFGERAAQPATGLTPADVANNRSLVDSIRLWDYRPLLDTYGQLQSLRPYYIFHGVDLDRYTLGGTEQQVMISARELNPAGLATQAQTWVNQHLVYTHGYGVVASPVNQIENAGQPHFLVHDLPPVSEDPVLQVNRPQIYYGEAEDNYVFVGTGTQEFDYPAGDGDKMTVYTGTGGIAVGNYLNRLQLAAYFGDFSILISEYIHDDSRALFHRDIHDAVQRVAPFLQYDSDPYIVIADGKLYWIQDAFTTSNRYPNSTPLDGVDGNTNYIRNSVKIVIDAYNGAMTFYVVDPTDPMIATYRRIFPSLFKDGATMPATLQAHIRYPETLFNVQAQMYELFHITDPQVFYNRGDAWNVPFGSTSDSSVSLQAYYTMMHLPGETRNQFMLLVPFTPASKPNMIAWMAARMDKPEYGRVDVIHFPASTNVLGPQQIDAQINQDPQYSSQKTLWNTSGSTVLQGNLLVIPLSDAVLYVEPLFLQATNSPLPELKRVIAASGGRVGLGEDLNSALTSMFGSQAQAPPPVAATPGPGTPAPSTPVIAITPGGPTPAIACTGDSKSLSADALTHYQRAQDALKLGDWATYGREQAQVEGDLRCLQQVTR